MRGCVDNCLICRCPPPSPHCVGNWSRLSAADATNQTGHFSRHQIEDYGVGLLPGLVEKE
jgi:hypothetical protein